MACKQVYSQESETAREREQENESERTRGRERERENGSAGEDYQVVGDNEHARCHSYVNKRTLTRYVGCLVVSAPQG